MPCVAVACNFSFLGSNKTLHVLFLFLKGPEHRRCSWYC